MHAGDGYRGAASEARLPANGMQEQRPAGDGLAMMVRVSQAPDRDPTGPHNFWHAKRSALKASVPDPDNLI